MEYKQLKILKKPIKFSYMMALLMVTLLIVFSATWFGFHLAKDITVPSRTWQRPRVGLPPETSISEFR